MVLSSPYLPAFGSPTPYERVVSSRANSAIQLNMRASASCREALDAGSDCIRRKVQHVSAHRAVWLQQRRNGTECMQRAFN